MWADRISNEMYGENLQKNLVSMIMKEALSELHSAINEKRRALGLNADLAIFQ